MAVEGRRYWAILTPEPASRIVAFAKHLESLGVEGLWGLTLPGPAFLPPTVAAAGTERIKLGTGLALAFTKSPLETALSAIDLDIISGGRVVLGLGPSTRFVIEGWHGMPYGKPLARLREATSLVRHIVEGAHAGAIGRWSGTHYQAQFAGMPVPRPVRSRIPVYLPALFSGAMRLAAEIADGLPGHPMWSLGYIGEQVIPTIEATLKAVDRPRSGFDLNLWTYVAIDPDRRQAIADARGMVAFYASIPQYERYFEAHDFGDAARRAAGAAASKDVAGLLRAIPDEMVHTFATAGTPDEVRERLESLWRLADSVTVLPPSAFIAPERSAAYQQALVETLFESAA